MFSAKNRLWSHGLLRSFGNRGDRSAMPHSPLLPPSEHWVQQGGTAEEWSVRVQASKEERSFQPLSQTLHQTSPTEENRPDPFSVGWFL